MLVGARAAGDSFRDANARSLELRHFVGVIRKQPDSAQAERLQGFGREFVVTRVVCKSKAPVRFHGVEACVLQLVGLQLIDQSDSAPFLWQVEQTTRRG